MLWGPVGWATVWLILRSVMKLQNFFLVYQYTHDTIQTGKFNAKWGKRLWSCAMWTFTLSAKYYFPPIWKCLPWDFGVASTPNTDKWPEWNQNKDTKNPTEAFFVGRVNGFYWFRILQLAMREIFCPGIDAEFLQF